MIREGEVIGAITVDRCDPKPFLDKQIGLVTVPHGPAGWVASTTPVAAFQPGKEYPE
jgi:hypothetical protein